MNKLMIGLMLVVVGKFKRLFDELDRDTFH